MWGNGLRSPQHLVVDASLLTQPDAPRTATTTVTKPTVTKQETRMAIAPEQIGIGIRRRFTSPDEHPYDTVGWERREARITNYKDGTDAFFQPDVEFPVTWSQNATNIVDQKYFRGTLGTAERESSLKQ